MMNEQEILDDAVDQILGDETLFIGSTEFITWYIVPGPSKNVYEVIFAHTIFHQAVAVYHVLVDEERIRAIRKIPFY